MKHLTPLEKLMLKIEAVNTPTATIYGGMHRLDLLSSEFLLLKVVLVDELARRRQTSAERTTKEVENG
jgi:hypothetical protein